jgi:hypothetical protein
MLCALCGSALLGCVRRWRRHALSGVLLRKPTAFLGKDCMVCDVCNSRERLSGSKFLGKREVRHKIQDVLM